MFTVLMAEWV